MVNRILLILGSILLNSCTTQQVLKDGITIVPPDKYIFKNRNMFKNNIFQSINKNHIYKLIGGYYADSNFKKIINTSPLGSYFLQFYDNGCLRGLNYLEPNPAIAGYRGIVYMKNKIIYIDRAGLSSDRSLHIYTYKLKIEGDYIYLLEVPKTLFKPSEYACLVYEKSEKIPEEWKQYKADW